MQGLATAEFWKDEMASFTRQNSHGSFHSHEFILSQKVVIVVSK